MTSVRAAADQLAAALRNAAVGRWHRALAEARVQLSSRQPFRSLEGAGRIALVSGTQHTTPPVGYGGVERAFYYQARDLSRRGWDVHLWGEFQDPATGLYEGMTLHTELDADGLDVLRVRPDVVYQAYPSMLQLKTYLRNRDCVVVGEFNAPECLPPLLDGVYVRCMNELFRDLAIAQGFAPEQVICVPLFQEAETEYQPAVQREDWLLWVGRPSPCKALEAAFLFARRSGLELRIASPRYDDSYSSVLWRLMPEEVVYVGEIDREQKRDLFSRCRALLYTSQPWWKEAFGLIFLDALASGTPVLAMDHHSGSTQSAFFPGPPYGLRAASIEELARLYSAHGHELRPDAVAARFEEIYGQERVERRLDSELRRLVESTRR